MQFKEREQPKKTERDADTAAPEDLYPGKTMEELRAALAFAEKKLQLVGSVTRHDVLNQLTAIVGYNELLGMIITDEKLLSYLEREKQAVDKIRRQFAFAKDYQNIGAAPAEWLPLRQLIHQACDAFDLRPIELLDDTGQVAVFGDPQILKALIQILENTKRHGGKATKVRIFLEANPSATGTTLVIEDDGNGIPEGDKIKIFDRGFGKGTGWGLFLAKEVFLFCGMDLRECGEPGRGARFEIGIPADKIKTNG